VWDTTQEKFAVYTKSTYTLFTKSYKDAKKTGASRGNTRGRSAIEEELGHRLLTCLYWIPHEEMHNASKDNRKNTVRVVEMQVD